ncbi:hypothetical protein ONR75_24705 [Rhodopseudomonas sp. P2A-2r]|uniref:hypothetical protein n=1 Tax=Rhodopseudomonas sp. P2A-2r TaxID=2991972 RepID=UPI00223486C1|nr:hypothetical protein [Rhodopseudomonas sp. P2A-2r]UZE48024.1 hypothetical protein ONR75_24705 [Rhodopseudomonas sp. P2A-2r]
MAGMDDRHPLSDRAAEVQSHAYLNGRDGETTQRIHELALVLGSLHRHAVQLASHGDDADAGSGLASSIEIDARAFAPPDPAPASFRPALNQDREDEKVLDKIALALAPAP